MENISWRICYIFYISFLQICKRYASALLPKRSFDNLYIQAGKLLTFLQMFSNSNPREIWCRNPPSSRIFPLVPSSLSCRTLLGGTPWWNAVGLDCAGSGPSRASTRTGPGEGRPPHQLTCSKENSPHELSKRFGTKSTQQKNSSPVLHMNSLNGVSALVGTTSTLVYHISRDLSRDCVAKHISFFW